MSYLLLLHRDAELTLATKAPIVPAEQVPLLHDALALCEHLSQLLASYEQRALAAEQSAREQGEQAGYAAGLERALLESAQTLSGEIARWSADVAAQREELRQALPTLAAAMVRRMAAELAPAAVLAALAERAFDHVLPPQPVRLRLPPEWLEAVRAKLNERELPFPVQCVADPELHGLRCTVESHAGRLLAGLDEALARINQSLETHRRTAAQASAHSTVPPKMTT